MKPNTYAALIDELAVRRDLTKKAVRELLDDAFATLGEMTWQHERVEIPGFAIFEVRAHRSRRVRHPATGKLMRLAEGRSVKCRVAGEWRTR